MTNQALLTGKSISLALVGGVLTTLSGAPTVASSFNPSPIYAEARSYPTEIPTTGSLTGIARTDIYYPVTDDPTATFPIALMLQGALVDKDDYANLANLVARYGFAVVVPNHERTLLGPRGPVTGFFPDVELVKDVLDFMVTENLNPMSPLQGKVEVSQMGLLGHSFGGAVGLTAVDGDCFPFFCNGFYSRPSELMAGIFYGAHTFNSFTGQFIPIDNQGIPTGLIAGELDGVSSLAEVQGTYDQIQDPPKVLVTALGANHYGITNEDNPERDLVTPELEQSVATETIARWSALFLRAHVQGDAGAFDYVYNTGDERDENVTVLSARVPEPSATLLERSDLTVHLSQDCLVLLPRLYLLRRSPTALP